MPAIEVKPGILHSSILGGVSLAMAIAMPIFVISLALAAASAWVAYTAGQANNRGDLATAYSKARTAGKLRVATYASWVVVGLIAALILLLGAAMMMESGYY
jgi:hypothetical protein